MHTSHNLPCKQNNNSCTLLDLGELYKAMVFTQVLLGIVLLQHSVLCQGVPKPCPNHEGEIRGLHAEVPNAVLVEYCTQSVNGELQWHYLCGGGVGWTPTLATVVCRELPGYSDQGAELGTTCGVQTTIRSFVLVQSCTGSESNLRECGAIRLSTDVCQCGTVRCQAAGSPIMSFRMAAFQDSNNMYTATLTYTEGSTTTRSGTTVPPIAPQKGGATTHSGTTAPPTTHPEGDATTHSGTAPPTVTTHSEGDTTTHSGTTAPPTTHPEGDATTHSGTTAPPTTHPEGDATTHSGTAPPTVTTHLEGDTTTHSGTTAPPTTHPEGDTTTHSGTTAPPTTHPEGDTTTHSETAPTTVDKVMFTTQDTAATESENQGTVVGAVAGVLAVILVIVVALAILLLILCYKKKWHQQSLPGSSAKTQIAIENLYDLTSQDTKFNSVVLEIDNPTYSGVEPGASIPQTNPRPVRDEASRRGEDFYDAEEHAYTVVDEKLEQRNGEGSNNQHNVTEQATPIPNAYDDEGHTYSVLDQNRANWRRPEDGEGERVGDEEYSRLRH